MSQKPSRSHSARLRLQNLEDRTVPSSPAVRFEFNGPMQQSTNPPAPSLAIGQTHIVDISNATIEWRVIPETGGSLPPTINSLNSFFTPLAPPSNATFATPRVVYDQFANRFVVAVVENVNVSGTTTSRILLAVSATNNPTGTWYFQSKVGTFDFSGQNTYAGQIGLAVDEEAVYVTTAQHRFTDDVYMDARLRILDKGIQTNGWYAGGSPVFTTPLDPDPTVGNEVRYFGLAPAHIYGTPPSGTIGTYLVAYNGAQSGVGTNESVQVVRIDNPLNDATRTFTATTIDVGNIDNALLSLPDAGQPGAGAPLIDTGDRRVGNAVWRNDQLYFAATINPVAGGDAGQATAHWFQLATATMAVTDQGNVGESVAANISTYYPSVAVDKFGNLAVGFAGSGAVAGNERSVGMLYAARLAGDAPGTLRGRINVDNSTKTYDFQTNGVSLWGPQTSMSVDPLGQSFWAFGAFADVPATSGSTPGRWASVAGGFSFNWPPDLDAPIGDVFRFEDEPPFLLPSLDLSFEDFDGTDADITYTIVRNTNTGLGTPTFAARNFILFSPTLNKNGFTDITIRATDAGGSYTEDTFRLTLTPAEDDPIAVNDSYATDEEVTLVVDAAIGLLANDTEPDGQIMEAFKNTNPLKGTVTVATDGSFTYVPKLNEFGSDSFEYRVVDINNNIAVGIVNITINPINDPPQAVVDVYSTAEDTPLSVAAPGVKNNDSDPDPFDFLTVALVDGPDHALVFNLNADGSFDYTPTANYFGPDAFTYKLNDGTVDSPTNATVTINVTPVDDVPVAVDDSYDVDEDDPNGITIGAAAGILSNDIEVDGDTLTIKQLSAPQHGTLLLNANGGFVYIPTEDNYFGTDQFTYSISDGTTESAPATVTLNVLQVNDPTVATGEAYIIDEDELLQIPAIGLLANDVDPDPDVLTIDVISPPAHASIFLPNPNGAFDYQPTANFYGADQFTYRVFDGTTYSNTVTVTLAIYPVQDPVVATDDFASTAGKAIRLNVLGNDTDPDNDTLQVASYSTPSLGRLARSGASLIYTPNKGATGVDTFTYVVADGRGSTDTATVQVTVTDIVAPTVEGVRLHYGATRYVDLTSTNRSVLPWEGVTKVSIVFREAIQAGPLATALGLTGKAGTLATTFAGFDVATRTATWNLAAPIGIDTVTLRLAKTGVLDISGNVMARDWAKRFAVLPGDFDGNGVVNDNDLKAIKKQFGKINQFADIDGNGFVNQNDLDRATLNKGKRIR